MLNFEVPFIIRHSLFCGSIFLLPRQFFVLDTLRVVFGTQPLLAVFFVLRVVAPEPVDLAVAFEGQHVSSNTIQEPAVV